jgi:hypothetical protein
MVFPISNCELDYTLAISVIKGSTSADRLNCLMLIVPACTEILLELRTISDEDLYVIRRIDELHTGHLLGVIELLQESSKEMMIKAATLRIKTISTSWRKPKLKSPWMAKNDTVTNKLNRYYEQ